jgi:hypothetical protein
MRARRSEMTHKMAERHRGYFPTSGITLLVVLLGLLCASGVGAQGIEGKVPAMLDLATLQIEAVEASYVTELRGSNASFRTTEPDKFRALVLTLRITKPSDMPLRLYAPDFTLHYTYGSTFDVSQCTGLSGFSTSQNVDRIMTLADRGYLSVAAAGEVKKASVLYVDVFFPGLEPDSRDLHLLVARPTGAMLSTGGWTPTRTPTPSGTRPPPSPARTVAASLGWSADTAE